MRIFNQAILAIIVSTLALSLAGCGVRGDPEPPQFTATQK
jgi:predicted small lipoprotein YifL